MHIFSIEIANNFKNYISLGQKQCDLIDEALIFFYQDQIAI
jgi:hypothetical protein